MKAPWACGMGQPPTHYHPQLFWAVSFSQVDRDRLAQEGGENKASTWARIGVADLAERTSACRLSCFVPQFPHL